MENSTPWLLKIFFLLTIILGYSSSSSWLHPLASNSMAEHRNYTAISDFRVLNRRKLLKCDDPNPYLKISVDPNSSLSNEEYLTVTVSGVLLPSSSDWVAMISPSSSNVTDCPLSEAYYAQTGDLSDLPLLCQYPVKAQYVKNDPDYLNCTKKECQESVLGKCVVATCSGSLTFHVINIRTNIEFVFFAGGFDTPCILTRSNPLDFTNPNMPLFGHLSSIDSTGKSMRLTWVSGDEKPQQVQYGDGMSQNSVFTTFTQDDMCSNVQPVVRVTRGPSKYLDIWDLPDEEVIELELNSEHQPVDDGARTFTGFLGTIKRKPHMCPIRYLNWKVMPEENKEECWRLVERKYCVPVDPIAYAALKRFALQKIGKAWRDHKSRLKKQHYIPNSRNKARVKSNVPTGCISQDWDILVEHWYTDDAVIESEKNKERRSKQDDVHTAGSCSFAVHAAKKAKTDGCPVERSVLYPILHTHKNGSIVNPVVAAKICSENPIM
ncbi:hypothetical protein SO802_008568 [Lithocarpus litseifolius]|uniref:Purple acid phosphatase Fn3-like domain-containing protein n=1 Tax=Lithocarpus litseifolius TaxID=425828 RepID=A0AAW2DD61_9ROSI